MNASILLRFVCLAGVVISAVFYFQVCSQKESLENNLNQSRQALQNKLEESASLKSMVLHAEKSSKQMIQMGEEEKFKASGYKSEFESLNTEKKEAEMSQNGLRKKFQN